MLDVVYGEAVRDLANNAGTEWQAGLREIADVNWALYLRHPWIPQVFTGRPPWGPTAIAKYELELGVVEDIGLSDVEMDAVITLIETHVEGVARRRIEADQVVRRTGLTDDQWWQAVGPAFAEVFEHAPFPIADRVGKAAGQAHQAAHNPEHAYACRHPRGPARAEGREMVPRRASHLARE